MSISRIAQAANVSYATAWRIINDQPCGSEEQKEAVRQAMTRLGYDPVAGRRRRNGDKPKVGRNGHNGNGNGDGIRTHNIALLHLRQGSSVSTFILNKVQRMLADRNLNLIFAHVEHPDQIPQAVRVGNVDGILGYGEFPQDAVTPEMRKIPAVWMMSRQGITLDQWGDRVKPDHQAIGQLAGQLLLDRSPDRWAYLNPETHMSALTDRLLGLRLVAEQARVPLDVFGCSGTSDLNEQARVLVDQWVASSPRAAGLFVPFDRVTLRIYRELERRNVRPGRDVTVVSCDNEAELLSLMHPPPTSIELNRTAIARLAVERLFWRMSNGTDAPPVVITVSPSLPKSPE